MPKTMRGNRNFSLIFVLYVVAFHRCENRTDMADRTRRFTSYSTAEDILKDIDLTGKTALITGTNSGIGTQLCEISQNMTVSEQGRPELAAG
jgi:hypothetical protein